VASIRVAIGLAAISLIGCDCPSGQVRCFSVAPGALLGVCTDTSNDLQNCGGCGNRCSVGSEVCREGQCQKCTLNCSLPKVLNAVACRCECPINSTACGASLCCGGSEQCCSGEVCCGGRCCGEACCRASDQCVNSLCCDAKRACFFNCCPLGQQCCSAGSCVTDGTPCPQNNCDSGFFDCGQAGPNAGGCCQQGQTCCGVGQCCGSNQTCLQGICVANSDSPNPFSQRLRPGGKKHSSRSK